MLFKQPKTQDELKRFYPAIFSESEKETLSNKYLYIPTYKLIDGLVDNGFKIIGASQAKSRTTSRDHAKHVVYLTHDNIQSPSIVGQEIPMLALTNSHNGLSSFAIDTAFFRLACSNGLLMPTSSMNSARIVHKIGMEQDVLNAAYSVVSEFPKQIEQILMMKQIELSRDEKYFLAESSQNIAFTEEQIELNKTLGREIAPRLLNARRSADQKDDLWATFNVIQENIIKGGVRIVSQNETGQRSLRKTRPVNSIDRDAKLNKELMALAQKILDLKKAA